LAGFQGIVVGTISFLFGLLFDLSLPGAQTHRRGESRTRNRQTIHSNPIAVPG
jgi:hypothetical protein